MSKPLKKPNAISKETLSTLSPYRHKKYSKGKKKASSKATDQDDITEYDTSRFVVIRKDDAMSIKAKRYD